MRASKFKQIGFDSSGSSMVKFMGKPISIDSHWRLETNAELLLCPNSLLDKSNICSGCSANLMKRHRFLMVSWDIKKKKWAVMLIGDEGLTSLMNEMKKAGVDPDLLTSGTGPAFLVQKIKTDKTEYSFLPMVETIGESIPEVPPSNEVLFAGLAKQSVWSV